MQKIKPALKKLIIEKEKWQITEHKGSFKILAFGEEFPLVHPVQVYLKLYRKETNPESKYLYMKAAHDYLWPKTEWHYWTEARFREHCKGWNYMSWAGGANCAKSHDSAKIACLFWLANPKKRTVVVTSTTLESLSSRIWGYVTRFMDSMAVKLPFVYTGGQAPKILYPIDKNQDREKRIKDTIHGMFALAAKGGEDEKAVSSWIGRHPEDALMVILDEATDINARLMGAFSNLDTGGKPFQCISIGNSNSIDDLHGAMSTPEDGWESIDPLKHNLWRTTRKNGICMFFSCYESPAIHEPDPEKRKRLAPFLITQETIDSKKKELGENSELFWRFTIGFWKLSSTENKVISQAFLEGFKVDNKTEWGGVHRISIVAGLDTAFSSGGDQCILRLGIIGFNTDGLRVLDFMGDKLTYNIPILRTDPEDATIQISRKVLKILEENRCPLDHLVYDATGQGRATGSVLMLIDRQIREQRMGRILGPHDPPGKQPIGVYSVKIGDKSEAQDVIVKSAYELWFTLRDYIQEHQIKGLDDETIDQLYSRNIVTTKTGKIALESKADYKKRRGAVNPALGKSPDKADSAALTLQAAIIVEGLQKGERRKVEEVRSFNMEKFYAIQVEKDKEIAKELAALNMASKPMSAPRARYLKGIESLKKKPF